MSTDIQAIFGYDSSDATFDETTLVYDTIASTTQRFNLGKEIRMNFDIGDASTTIK